MFQMRRVRLAATKIAAGLILGTALSCGESLAPLATAPSPEDLSVRAVGIGVVRLTWTSVDDPNVVSYEVQRRVDHAGVFLPLAATVMQASQQVVYIDTDVQPETFYGYRVVAVTRYGDKSRPSVVGGARTPSPPGIVVQTQSEAPVPEAMDPDGYRIALRGPDSATAAMGLVASQRFAPLTPGNYIATLRGVIARCEVDGDSVRTVVVTDTGVNTLSQVSYRVRCRDPKRGRVVALVAASGDSADANGFRATATGILDDATLPDSLRVVRREIAVASSGGSATFDNLQPGSYEIQLTGLDGQCTTPDPLARTIAVKESSTDTVRFRVVCESNRPPDDGTRPLIWRNSWSAESVPPGQKAHLTLSLDASAMASAGVRIAATQGELRFDDTILRFDKAEASPDGGLDGVTAQVVSPGVLALVSVDNSGAGKGGIVPMARIEFTVIGAVGTSAATRTKVTEVVDAGANLLQDSTRVIEDTLAVGVASTVKQPPVANANGPYSGSTAVPVSFSAAGSNDPDGGAIASYRWNFGDGTADVTTQSATTTHTFVSPGAFTVSLTVTDDEGATATVQTSATITTDVPVAGKPYVWRNSWSPTTAAVGATVALTAVIDASAVPAEDVSAVSANVRYNSSVLRFDRSMAVSTNGLNGLTANGTVPGIVSIAAIDNNGVGVKGVVGVARLEFTVLAASPSSVATQTELVDISDKDLNALLDSTRVVEATLTIGTGDGTVKQPPVANANGPYSAVVGAPITFSAAGSSDPDGGAVTYNWNFGDGGAPSTLASPSHTYGSAGAYTVTLTVTDDEGVTASATASVTITAAGPGQPPEWRYSFSVVNDTLAVLEILYDMQADLPETPSIETLASWDVDSLKWNPGVLRYITTSGFGQGGGSANSTFASSGKLSLHGTLSAPFNQGLIQIATIQFRIVGARGASTTTQTFLGTLKNAAGFNYTPKTSIKEETFIVP